MPTALAMVDTSLYANIPQELKQLNQWVVWQHEDGTKVPYDAKNNHHASHSDVGTWSSFDLCVRAVSGGVYSGIGFVFCDSDPYCFVDLDDPKGDAAKLERQIKIFKEFDSYSEKSPSGSGLHVIIKGHVPSGRKRSSIEVYSSKRYATFTGNVYNDKLIEERQELLTQLWEQMGSGPASFVYKGDDVEKYTDEEVIKQAEDAANGDKYKMLYQGDWKSLYPSQSEADLALIDIIAFYTQNSNQIIRLFRRSTLGKRDKALRQDYMQWMINKSFDRMLPQLDFDGFKNALENKFKHKPEPVEIQLPLEGGGKTFKSSIPLPEGLMGELAKFIYQAAPRPVPEIALAGAIGLMAGICGRAYNISGTGLNQYIMVLAKTGRGKEAAAIGIDKLMNAIRMQVPTSTRFRGPAIINSGQALVKHLSKVSNCFISVLGEFGLTIERISNKSANSSDKMLYQMLLDLYNKSGHGQTLQASIYAKKEDNVDITDSPALSILGESTHKLFYDSLHEEMIAAGLLPRFLIIEYNGERVDLNEEHDKAQPPFALIEKLVTVVANAEMIMHAKRVINVKIAEDAHQMLRSFDRYATDKINSNSGDTVEELWNRAHMKALRLSALVAVGVNPFDPTITVTHAQWAIDLVQSDIRTLSTKFEAGEVGGNSLELKQSQMLTRVMRDYVSGEWGVMKAKYGLNKPQMFDDKVVPYAYLSRRLVSQSPFKNDKMGATNAINRTIKTLIDGDKIREVNRTDLINKYNTTQRSFMVSDVGMFS